MTNPDTAKRQPERETEGIALSLADPSQSRGRLSRFRRGDSPQRWFAIGWGVVGIVAVLLLWELYKFLGPAEGVVVGGTAGESGSGFMILPRTHDRAMPHIWDMVARLFAPTSGGDTPPLWVSVASAALVTLGIAAVGWLIGVAVGSDPGPRDAAAGAWSSGACCPGSSLSQIVPLIAFAPVINAIGNQIDRGGTPWPQWLSVAVIASYLAFFPVAIGVLRGLAAPDRIHVDLMRTYAAGYWPTIMRLRLPAAVPVPAAGAAARRGQRGARRGRRRGVDRHARRHRPHADPARRSGLERPRRTVGPDVRLDRPRTDRGRLGRAHRPRGSGTIDEEKRRHDRSP